MRQFKFRIWDPDAQQFRETCTINQNGIIESSWGKEKYNWIIQQYTGLKDLNAREIYEGDIVNCKSDYSKLSNQIISYDDKNAAFKLSCGLLVGYSKDVEILGNIFENKELLCER